MHTTDVQIVEAILDEMKGQNNRRIAQKVVWVLGKRIRQRARNRRGEDLNQAAFRSVQETIKRGSD